VPCDIAWLPGIVQTITSRALKKLTLWFNAAQINWVGDFDFASLEQILLQHFDPAVLPDVCMNIIHTRDWVDAHEAWIVAKIEAQLPELVERGRLAVYPNFETWFCTEALDKWWPYV
jgi:hypothetical protein